MVIIFSFLQHTSPITYYNETTSLTLYYCFDVENDLTFIVSIYQLLVMFIVPALFMLVCYYVVIRQLWLSTQTVNSMTRTDNRTLNRNHSVTSMTSASNRTAIITNNNTNNNSSHASRKNETIELTQTDRKISGGNAAAAASEYNHQYSKWSWLRYLNVVYLWHQWRFNKELHDLLSSGQQSGKHNGGAGISMQDASDAASQHRRHSRDSEEEKKEGCCTCANWKHFCCWPSCEHTFSGGRHVGEEVSECTMSSSYQMTSYSDKTRHEQQCNSSERQSPVDAMDALEEDHHHHHQNAFYVGSSSNEAHRSRPVDNHTIVVQHSRPLANNVMEITRSRFQVNYNNFFVLFVWKLYSQKNIDIILNKIFRIFNTKMKNYKIQD